MHVALCGFLALFCLASARAGAADMPAPVVTYGDAMRWYGQAAEAGDPQAQFYLGYIHDRGLHGANSLSEAIGWYRKAAAQGELRAQFRLGLLFDSDPRLPRDPAEAQTWYEAAAAQGHAKAQFNLARLVEAEDAARAAGLYALAAEAGIGPAAFNLALLHINGPGELYDPSKAWRWALRAQDLGAPGAGRLRDRLSGRLRRVGQASGQPRRGQTAAPAFGKPAGQVRHDGVALRLRHPGPARDFLEPAPAALAELRFRRDAADPDAGAGDGARRGHGQRG